MRSGLGALFGGPITGASMNPARSLGPALVSGHLHDLWIYLLAPAAGAVLGALAYQLIRGSQQPVPSAPQPRRWADFPSISGEIGPSTEGSD